MKSSLVPISILIASLLIVGVILFAGENSGDNAGNNVSIVDGKQIIEIDAKGGYNPRKTAAKADIPTVLKIKTSGTFDCSSALVIPSLGYRKNLPPSGEILVDIPLQKAGSAIQGMCAMGMYNFTLDFN
ncbi:MAG: hypothetical protein A3H52_02205 [Candidatus Zambryskibacteria bacterium RIFCSPLOWO2_02_FULL_39_26]|uniref:EfeO-type cupredoxin-like domain-containing protein n=1 Tax=Candidatus Zambryskibacteria bacterium RIFCSPLOWO2_12_FULL_39_23 TaxID=1802776 RepID=A0A1G2URN4_9BACT|nr:MAG: hypothetical protein A2W51_01030 [Candidatus Zambryskibacteria bacterium RIFCSPHIGHO2_02_39_10]OHA98818.1 MAG: hypothetical protein A3E59_00655 [Candidatus Zambryskibacteria bacterium RIFCSPHIGHO2_12_FULL_39_47]OHB09402.1 MAG: hypothetical protein A3H52_02205 [Candidatus Zambryskibacteria bacterium RIFCSPLOWO2_02_FULL_39_26]OHB11982.1 MAG: hypothetical protein A3G99_02770 [Candidatus Zambryskibacteria bacterium RIFCSPLOWO2_12_FULL_39_23]